MSCFDVFIFVFFFYCYGDHRELHVLTHSFPTRRSSDLLSSAGMLAAVCARWARALSSSSEDTRPACTRHPAMRSEEHTSELQSLMRISYAVFCLKKKNNHYNISKEQTHKSRSNTTIQY